MNAQTFDQLYNQLPECQRRVFDSWQNKYLWSFKAAQKNRRRIMEIKQKLGLGEEK